jgi:hypothetical protein
MPRKNKIIDEDLEQLKQICTPPPKQKNPKKIKIQKDVLLVSPKEELKETYRKIEKKESSNLFQKLTLYNYEIVSTETIIEESEKEKYDPPSSVLVDAPDSGTFVDS